MIGSGPESRFIGFGTYFDPFFCLPVEKADGVESLFVGSSSSKKDQLVVILVVVHCTV